MVLSVSCRANSLSKGLSFDIKTIMMIYGGVAQDLRPGGLASLRDPAYMAMT